MYCPTCGQENPDDARVCRSCNSVLTRTPTEAPTIAVRTSGMAIAALVLGILSIFTLGLTGIPAIILGIISLVTIGQSGGRLTGKGFAIGGIITPVLAVPVLLMIILMPALNRVKEQSRAVLCMANLGQWGSVLSMYCEDNDGQFPSGETPQGFWWVAQLEPRYQSLKQNQQWFCPAAKKPMRDEYGNPMDSPDIFNAWGIYTRQDYGKLCADGIAGSYGINGYVLSTPPSTQPVEGARTTQNNWRTPDVTGANNIPLFIECLRFDLWPSETDAPALIERDAWTTTDHMAHACINRHEGYVNGLFMDWSARKIGLKQLWTLKWHRAYDTTGPWTLAGGAKPVSWPQWMRNFRDY